MHACSGKDDCQTCKKQKKTKKKLEKDEMYWDNLFFDGNVIVGQGLSQFRFACAFFDPDTGEPFHLQANIITDSLGQVDRYPHVNLDAGIGYNLDLNHSYQTYSRYNTLQPYSKPLPFRAKTIFYYGNASVINQYRIGWRTGTPPPIINVFKDMPDYDILVETRIQCYTCKNVDSYKQWLRKDGGGDCTCSNFGIYQCKCKKTKIILFLRNVLHYIPTEYAFGGLDTHLHLILEGKQPVITNFPPEVESQYKSRSVQSSNNSIFQAIILSVILGVATGGALGAAGIPLLPSIASASSPALMGVNIAACAGGSALNTIISGGNIGVNINFSKGGIKANDIHDIAINYINNVRDTTFYYLNNLSCNSAAYNPAMICKRLQSFTDISSRSVKEWERENEKIWINRREIV